jgi:predicted transcriptional regulator
MNKASKLKRTTIYISPELQEALRTLGKAHKRSFTGEVLWALEQYVQAHQQEMAPVE